MGAALFRENVKRPILSIQRDVKLGLGSSRSLPLEASLGPGGPAGGPAAHAGYPR
jgi:hypothetical protein